MQSPTNFLLNLAGEPDAAAQQSKVETSSKLHDPGVSSSPKSDMTGSKYNEECSPYLMLTTG